MELPNPMKTNPFANPTPTNSTKPTSANHLLDSKTSSNLSSKVQVHAGGIEVDNAAPEALSSSILPLNVKRLSFEKPKSGTVVCSRSLPSSPSKNPRRTLAELRADRLSLISDSQNIENSSYDLVKKAFVNRKRKISDCTIAANPVIIKQDSQVNGIAGSMLMQGNVTSRYNQQQIIQGKHQDEVQNPTKKLEIMLFSLKVMLLIQR